MTNAIEINCATGEVIERPLTAKEIAQQKADAEAFAIEQDKREADAIALQTIKESAKAKLVAGEPLTEEEAATLII